MYWEGDTLRYFGFDERRKSEKWKFLYRWENDRYQSFDTAASTTGRRSESQRMQICTIFPEMRSLSFFSSLGALVCSLIFASSSSLLCSFERRERSKRQFTSVFISFLSFFVHFTSFFFFFRSVTETKKPHEEETKVEMSRHSALLALAAVAALVFLCCLGLSNADKQVNLGSEDLPEDTLELSSNQFQVRALITEQQYSLIYHFNFFFLIFFFLLQNQISFLEDLFSYWNDVNYLSFSRMVVRHRCVFGFPLTLL